MTEFSSKELEEKADVVHFNYRSYWDESLVVFKEKAAEIIIPVLFVIFLSIVFSQVFTQVIRSIPRMAYFSLMGNVLTYPLFIGLFSYIRKKMNNEEIAFNYLFSFYGKEYLLNIMVFYLCYNIVLILAFALCFVPGFLIFLGSIFLPLFFLDLKEKDPKSIFKACYLLYSKNMVGMSVLTLAIVLLACAGALACGVGLLVSVPFSCVFMIYAWEDLKKQLKLGEDRSPRVRISLEKDEE